MINLPTLRWGSIGQHVKNLQYALNLWPKSVSPPLNTDGIFGPKTDAKVREFQRGNGLVSDGIVGPMTWGNLSVFLQQITTVNPDDRSARIVEAAQRALQLWGWPGGVVERNKYCPSIAAAYCADRNDVKRPRQGYLGLATIFTMAGAPNWNVFTIKPEAERKWRESSNPEDPLAKQIWLNRNDIPAWCGIFCCFVYRWAGMNTGNWSEFSNNLLNNNVFQTIHLEQAFAGCVGNIRRGNHFFIVVENKPFERRMVTIDGNAWGPEHPDNLSLGNRSVIKRRWYGYNELKEQNARFYFPR